MPPACLHDDCTVGLTTKQATQPIKCKFALVGNCQELLWKFTDAKKLGKSVREIEAAETDEVVKAQTSSCCLSSGSSSE